jgi:glucose/arabinose dehydrogenase
MSVSTTAAILFASAALAAALGACGGTTTALSNQPASSPTPSSTASASPAPTTDPQFHTAPGFTSNTIAAVPSAREIVALPNGDLLVGTSSDQLYVVPGAENAGSVGTPSVFITLPDAPAQGVAISPDRKMIYAVTEYDVFSIPYKVGDRSEPDSSARKIASIRTGPIAPGSDGDVHTTSSVAVTATTLYVGVGSSCNACVEVDPTRASVQAMNTDGTGMHTLATRERNPIALAINPASNVLWAGGAGQDNIPYGHPYEFMDAITLQSGSPVDYGWPDCEENHVAYTRGAQCANVAVPRVEFPAFATHIGATFYPSSTGGAYVFPTGYRGGLFVTSHGSWHCCPSTPPEVAFVAMNGDAPRTPVNWNDPNAQWTPFMWNLGAFPWTYLGRPTGIAVGSQGSLFVADDRNDVIYRIRPVAGSRLKH